MIKQHFKPIRFSGILFKIAFSGNDPNKQIAYRSVKLSIP